MNYGAILTYDNGAEQIVFERTGDFWITQSPDLSSIQIEASESQTAGQIGSSINAQAVKSKALTFTGSIMRNVEVNRAKMIRVVQPQTPARLIYTYQNSSWYLDVVPTQTPLIAAGIVLQDFQFQVRAAYPYWRDTTDIAISVAGIESLFEFPFNTGGNWYISQFTESFFTAVYNMGNVAIGMQIKIYAVGDMSNPEVLNLKNGQLIKINRNFIAGEHVLINTEYGKRAITVVDVNGISSNGFKFMTGDSDITMQLEPGENIFRFDADVGREVARVSLIAPQRGVLSGV